MKVNHSQFVNGLKKGLTQLMIPKDDLLKTPEETAVKIIARDG